MGGFGADADAIDPVDGSEKTGDEAGGGGKVHFAGGADLLNFPFVHDGDLIGEGEGFFLIVGDEKERDAETFLELFELDADAFAEGGVEGGEGFVEEEEFGFDDEGAGEGGALFFTAGEISGEAVAFFLEADEIEHFFHFGGDGAFVFAAALESEGDVLGGG